MRDAISLTVKVCAVVIVWGSLASATRGNDLVLDWDFQQPDGAPNTRPRGASKLVTNLWQSATIQTGPNQGLALANFQSELQRGSMTVAGGENRGLGTIADPRLDPFSGSWRAYLGEIGFVPVTFATVYKPNFKGLTTNVHVLVSVSTFNGSNGIALGIRDDSSVMMYTGVSGPPGNSAGAAVPGLKWDPDTWYFIAGSAEQGKPATVYIRPLSGRDLTAVHFAISPTLVNDRQTGPTAAQDYSQLRPGADGQPDTHGPHTESIRIGGTPVFYFADKDDYGADGTFARVQILKRYLADQKGFDELYRSQFQLPPIIR